MVCAGFGMFWGGIGLMVSGWFVVVRCWFGVFLRTLTGLGITTNRRARPFQTGYPKVRKGLLFAQRSPFREKDYPKMRKGLFCHEMKFHLFNV